MQIELSLQVGQLLGVGLLQPDPDKVTGFRRPGGALIEGDIGDFSTSTINCGGNDSTHNTDRFFFKKGKDRLQLSLISFFRVSKPTRIRAKAATFM